VDDFTGVVAAAIGAFAGTNVDDIIVLAVLFTAGRTVGRPAVWQVWAGQYLGVCALIAVSVVAALGLTLVPDKWVGLLGLVPLALGVRGLVQTVRSRDDDAPAGPPEIAGSVLAISAVTVANGADNIAIYTPMFRTMGTADVITTVAVFVVMIGVWCAAGLVLGSRRRVTDVIERWGHWLVPAVFIGIGAFIVVESRVLGHIVDLL
jgi:cadmium resistance transport/sequestration family protein